MTIVTWSETRRWCTRVCALAVVPGALVCTASAQDVKRTSIPPFSVASVRLIAGADTIRLRVELATNDAQRNVGLSEREKLADTAGMLFLYPTEQPASYGFWMFRTRIPLDIAFLDSLGVIVAIKHMVPCASTVSSGCPMYPPGMPYRAALEVNAGYLARHKLSIGSRLILSDTSRVVRRRARG